MPDLVYNVKFNIDQPSPQQMPSGVGGGPSGPPAGQQSQIDNLTKSTQRYTQILERYNNLARTNGKLTTQQRLAYTKASRTVENYRADLLLASEAVENLSTQQIQSLNKAVSGANRSLGSASGHLQGMGNSMSGVNKIGNNSNQILLSFGDALQDSAQFSQGFASGMRAVGNNLTFAAEQFGYAMAQAGGFRNALKSMGQQLKGPVGVIVGFNAAVTATLLFAQAVEKSTKKLEEQGKKVAEFYSGIADDVSSAVAEVEDPLGAIAAEQQLVSLENSLVAFQSITGKTFQSLKEEVEESGWGGFAGIADVVTRSATSIGEFFGYTEGEIIKNSAAVAELTKQIEGLEAQQAIRAQIIASSETLQILQSTIRSVNNDVFGFSVTQDVAAKRAMDFKESMSEQIQSLIAVEDPTQNQILALTTLLDIYDKLNKSVDKNTEFTAENQRISHKGIEATLGIMEIEAQRGTIQDKFNLATSRANAEAYRQREIISNNVDALESEAQALFDTGKISEEDFKTRTRLIEAMSNNQTELANQQEANAVRQAELNKVIGQADVVQSLAQTTAVLGQIFGASKEMQIAMAVIDGGAAIVKTFAQLGFPAGIPAALAVAAKTAQTISQMKSVKPGDSKAIDGSSQTPSSQAANPIQRGFSEVESPAYLPGASRTRGEGTMAQVIFVQDETGTSLRTIGAVETAGANTVSLESNENG